MKIIEERELYREKSMTRMLRYLRKNTIEKNFVSAEEIINDLSLTKSQVSTNLGILEHDHLLKVKVLNYKHRTDPRKVYKLNKKGLNFVELREFRAFNKDEIKILNLYHRIMKSKNPRLIREFVDLIQLFDEYGFSEKASDLAEMVGNLVKKVRKFFRYEVKFALNMNLAEST